MRRTWLMITLFALSLPLFIACSGEKDEDDWVDDLRDRRTRDAAMLYVQEHRSKKAVPILLDLLKRRYGSLKAVFALGLIGDPVAVPQLIEELKRVGKMDSLDNDRLTEQICMSLGHIGESSAVDALLWAIDNVGEMGRAGAVQALGMIGDPRATQKLMDVLYKDSEKILIRHYAAISLGKLKAKEAADALVYGLFVDDTSGLNLFRDCQQSLIQLGGKEARDALVKGYELKNEKLNELAKSIDIKEDIIKIKIVNVMGELRDPDMADYLMTEFGKGLKNEFAYELQAKIIQALARVPIKKEHLNQIVDLFIKPPDSIEYLNEREIMSQVLIAHFFKERWEDIMQVAEKGDIVLRDLKKQLTPFSQVCFAAANVASILGDHTQADRFDAFVKSDKCQAPIFGQKKKTSALIADFNVRMQAAKKCQDNLSCWQKLVSRENKNWPEVEKALYMLAASGDKKYIEDVFRVMLYPNEQVRDAVLFAVLRLAHQDVLPALIKFWQEQKINKEFQKVTEDIGYVIFLRMREWGQDGPAKVKEIMRAAEKYKIKKTGLVPVQTAGKAPVKEATK